jgi:hypothetical protein
MQLPPFGHYTIGAEHNEEYVRGSWPGLISGDIKLLAKTWLDRHEFVADEEVLRPGDRVRFDALAPEATTSPLAGVVSLTSSGVLRVRLRGVAKSLEVLRYGATKPTSVSRSHTNVFLGSPWTRSISGGIAFLVGLWGIQKLLPDKKERGTPIGSDVASPKPKLSASDETTASMEAKNAAQG